MHSFYPRCFVLTKNDKAKKDPNNALDDPLLEWDNFKEYFRLVWAESILKRFKGNGKKPCTEKVIIALNVTEKRLMSLDEILE